MVNVAIAVMKYHDQKQIEAYISISPFINNSGQEFRQDRNLEAGSYGEAMEECCYWFVYHGFLSTLSYRNQDHRPRDAITHNGQILSHQEVIEKMHGH